MDGIFSRTIQLIGENNLKKLKKSKVLLFGIGGVGGYTLEALIRAGVGQIDIVDNDVVSDSNINRQILATTTTIGRNKIEVASERAKIINPNINIKAYNIFYLPNDNSIDFTKYNYVIDAIDTVTAKFDIIKNCNINHIPLISCMGTGNKLDATKLKIMDIYDTKYCKLAKVVRKYCKDNNIKKLTVVSSDEQPIVKIEQNNGRHIPASISYVPAVAGMLLAQHVILEIIKD